MQCIFQKAAKTSPALRLIAAILDQNPELLWLEAAMQKCPASTLSILWYLIHNLFI